MIKEIKAEVRENTGKGAVNRLRKTGFIPGVMYGTEAPVPVSLNAQEFNRTFKKINDSEIVNLVLGSKSHKVMIKDTQRNYIRGEVTHLDFMEVNKDSVIHAHIPLKLEGTAPGIKEGGILEHALHALEVECKVGSLVEHITVDVSGLVSGHAIHVKDIKAGKGIKVLSSPDQVVASVTHAKAVVEAAPAAPAAAEAAPAKAVAAK